MPRVPANKIELPWKLNLFTMALLFLAALCCCAVAYCRSHPALNLDPYNAPWFREHYPDLLLLQPRFAFFHSRQFFTAPGATPYLYPAPDSVIYKAFYVFSRTRAVECFLCFSIAAYAFAGALYSRALTRRGIPIQQAAAFTFSTLLCCYPLWFELKQANIEIVTWVFISSGFAFFLSRRSYAAAICFCLAGSMKLYPVIFLGLLLEKRQYKPILVGLTTFGAVTLLSTWLLCPDFTYSWRSVQTGVDQFRDQYILRYRYETVMDHSLFASIKAIWHPLPAVQKVAHALDLYLATVAVVGIILWFTRIRHQPVFNQILALTIASILFPPTSFEYTLQHLLAPFALFTLLLVDGTRLGIAVSRSKTYLLCFLVLLAPISEVIYNKARLDGRIKSLVLLILFIVSLVQSVSLDQAPDREAPQDAEWWEVTSSTRASA